MNYRKVVISIDSNLGNAIGADLIYQQCIFEASKLSKLKNIFIGNNSNLSLPNVIGGLPNFSTAGLFNYPGLIVKYFLTLKFILANLLRFNKEYIIIIQSFSGIEIFIISIVLLLSFKKNFKLFLIWRFPIKRNKLDLRVIAHKVIKISGYSVKYFCDTDDLAANNSTILRERFDILPIPHASIPKTVDPRNERMICWWAGPPRVEKGMFFVQKLVLACAKNFELEFWMVANPFIKPDDNIIFMNAELNRAQYVELFSKVDILLFPYDVQSYKLRSSGIFVEAITGGKLVIVSEGTWMASQLSKFNLEELTQPLNLEKWTESILNIKKNKNLANKIKKMSEAYSSFHNLNTFAIKLFSDN